MYLADDDGWRRDGHVVTYFCHRKLTVPLVRVRLHGADTIAGGSNRASRICIRVESVNEFSLHSPNNLQFAICTIAK
jgi:hypothetical protein